MTETEVRNLIEQFMEAWNRRDLDTFMTFLDDSVTWSDPAMLYGPAVGKEEVREFCENVLRAFPDFTYRIREPICISSSCERCAIPWTITATHSGPFEPVGFAPTDQTITMEGVDLIELSGTRLKRIETLFSVLPAMEQALRLKPFPRKGIRRALVVGLQRTWAWSLRRRNRKGR
jgi:steroid delta-isomerase-like uncharacterized protein